MPRTGEQSAVPFIQLSVDVWGALSPGLHLSGGRERGVNETNPSVTASPKKRGQPARTVSIVGKNDCKTGSQIDMDLHLRYFALSLDGLRVLLCTMGLFYALDTSLHVKHQHMLGTQQVVI